MTRILQPASPTPSPVWETFETNPQFWIIGAIVVLIFAGLVIRVLSRNRLNKKRGKR